MQEARTFYHRFYLPRSSVERFQCENRVIWTPFEKNRLLDDEERMRIVAVYRFINPEAAIRLAGGRGLIADKGRACFRSGANAVISGDMLTTAGYSIETDMEMIDELGYKPELCHD